LAVLGGSLALGAVAVRSAWSSRAAEPPDVRAKGEAVREAVDKAYERFPGGTHGEWRDISSVVAAHIPAGTAYDLAEAILWRAGFDFTWARRIAARPMDESLKMCPTEATRDGLMRWPLGDFEVSVTLEPDRLANFDRVERARTVIRVRHWI
jgi:hypothetical protein